MTNPTYDLTGVPWISPLGAFDATSEKEIRRGALEFDELLETVPHQRVIEVAQTSQILRTRMMVLSATMFVIGASSLDLISFLTRGSYLLHPYFTFTIAVAGVFLLITILVALKDN